MACDLHRHAAIHTRFYEIAGRTAAKVVGRQTCVCSCLWFVLPKPEFPTGRIPDISEVLKIENTSAGFGKDLRSSRRVVAISSSGPASGIVSGSSFFMISRGSVISLQSLSIIVHVIFLAAPERHPLKYKKVSVGRSFAGIASRSVLNSGRSRNPFRGFESAGRTKFGMYRLSGRELWPE